MPRRRSIGSSKLKSTHHPPLGFLVVAKRCGLVGLSLGGTVSLLFLLILVVQNLVMNRYLRALSASSFSSLSAMHDENEKATARTTIQTEQQLLDDFNFDDDGRAIRSWGCNITASPLIFVHIGKAGGGNVRRRLAAAALNYTREPHEWNRPDLDHHYYPIREMTNVKNDDGSITNITTITMHRGKFCSSQRHRHPPRGGIKSFEGLSQPCTATTALGHMLACPEIFHSRPYCPYDPKDPESTHLVYAGHNYLGSEVHWLPAPSLVHWWQQQHHWNDGSVAARQVGRMLANLDGVRPWCGNLTRPVVLNDMNEQTQLDDAFACAQQRLEQVADDLSEQIFEHKSLFHHSRHRPAAAAAAMKDNDAQETRDRAVAQAQIYASLPVARVVVLREPIAWLNSKFAWHARMVTKHGLRCDNVTQATDLPEGYTQLHSHIRPGWARLLPLHYLFFLCGEDCMTRLEAGRATLAELEAQAAYNLRHSFAVVGLLEQEQQEETFWDMMDARVDYITMTMMDNAADIDILPSDDGRHRSNKDPHCDALFRNDANFVRRLAEASPELRALQRLYEIGRQVNRFQRKELRQCGSKKSSNNQALSR